MTKYSSANGEKRGRDAIDRAAYQAKAEAWSYEDEWRILGPAGNQKGILNLTEIVFGLQCPEYVRTTIRSIIRTSRKKIRFSEITVDGHGYNMQKRALDETA